MALILAAHVKLIALIWAPAMALWIITKWGWRRSLGIGAGGLAAGGVISYLLYQPYDGWGSIPRMLQERSLFLANSIWDVLAKLLSQWGTPHPVVNSLMVNLPSIFFLALAVGVAAWSFNLIPGRWKRAVFGFEDGDLWRVLVLTGLFYLMIGAFWFQHWYFLWVLAPAALLPGSRFLLKTMPWLCFGGLLVNLMGGTIQMQLEHKVAPFIPALILVILIWGPGLMTILRRKPYPSGQLYQFLFDQN